MLFVHLLVTSIGVDASIWMNNLVLRPIFTLVVLIIVGSATIRSSEM